MNKLNTCLLALCLPLSLMAQEAQESPAELSGWVELGAMRSSNVNLEQIETASGRADNAATLDAGLDLALDLGPQTQLTSGYSYLSQAYDRTDAFNLQMHLLYGDLSHSLGATTLGANYYYADANLDGDAFMNFSRPSLYLGYLSGEQLYLRAALEWTDKEFTSLPGRDADVLGLKLDSYWYFPGGDRYIALSLAREEEDAAAEQFSWQGNSLRLRYADRLDLFGKASRLQLGMRLDGRDYRGVTPSIGEARDDSRLGFNAELEIWLHPNLSVIGRVERTDYDSNLPSANYTDNQAALAAKFSF